MELPSGAAANGSLRSNLNIAMSPVGVTQVRQATCGTCSSIRGISIREPSRPMIAAARKFKHRRLPIYDETPDTIVGVLNTRALLLDPAVDLAEAIEFPSFVPESMNLLQLLKSLQRQQRGVPRAEVNQRRSRRQPSD